MGRWMFFVPFLILTGYRFNSEGSTVKDHQAELTLPTDSAIHRRLLKEILSGPLRGVPVTLVIRENEESLDNAGIILKTLDTPVYLLRLPKEMPVDVRFHLNSSAPNDVYGPPWFPLDPSVFVILLDNDASSWWPLYASPNIWSTKAVVIVSAAPCHTLDLLQIRVAEKSPSLALICPYESQWNYEFPNFQLFTLRPFASKQKVVSLGSWNPENFRSWNEFFIDRFTDMTGKKVSILCQTKDRPLIYTDSAGILKGLNFKIMASLSKWLHFKIKYVLQGNVRWTTMTDLVKEGVNDVMINYATLTPERNDDFDLTVPYYREGFGLMLEIPPPLPRWRNALYPFSWQVWSGIAVSLLATGVTLHLLYHKDQPSLINNIITVTQSILSSPLAVVPIQWRVRYFLITWWIISWILTMSYTCNLIAVLTVPVFPKKLQTAQELVESNYRLCMLDYGEFVPEALATSTHPTLSALGAKLDMMPIIDHLEEIGEETCAELVVAGTHAHTETYSYVKILYSKLGHNTIVYDFKEQLYPGYLAFMVHKNSPWKYKFDQGMQWLMETGLTDKWYQESMDEFIDPIKEDHTLKLQPLSVAHLQGPFLILLLGMSLSSMAMGWEVLSYSSNKLDLLE